MTLTIAAVVATRNRPYLLANRSLASIAAQTRPPDLLVVVDDSEAKYRRTNQEITSEFHSPGTKVVHLLNYRTPGASGAWNTALAWLASHEPQAFVAILDDDDAWEPGYLEQCESAAGGDRLDMVVSGLLYHESPSDAGLELSIPSNLNIDELLVKNAHIQGSNLFVRLRTLLEAGAFDEALASTTDRDLCIRLADLGYVLYGTVEKYLVHHYAEPSRSRLSSPGSTEKSRGLTTFYRKHSGRMTGKQRTDFKERSRKLFGCEIDDSISAMEDRSAVQSPPIPKSDLKLVVGAITSPATSNIARLLSDLESIFVGRADVELKVVLLENSNYDKASRVALGQIVEGAGKSGLDVELIGFEQQANDSPLTDLGVTERKSIAESRTMLQRYLFLEAKLRPGSMVWILDDDCRIDNQGTNNGATPDLISHLKRLKQTDYGVVLGAVTGDPPLPFSSCIRTQMVDLHSNLEWMAVMSPHEPMPSRAEENQEVRKRNRDYYYDLSRSETDHLETPFWYAPRDEMTVAQAFQEMVRSLPDMLRGVQVFRPLVQEESDDPLQYAVPSVNRGPSTFVLDIQALREFPNAVPNLDGTDTRRSDMVWSLLNRFVARRKVVQVPLAVRQDRSFVPLGQMDFEKLAQDIRGYALYSSLHDLFLEKTAIRRRAGRSTYGPSILMFSEGDLSFAVGRFGKYIRERLNAFDLSFVRIQGLLKSFHRFTDRKASDDRCYWWLESEEYAESVEALKRFVLDMSQMYTDSALQLVKKRVLNADVEQVREFLKNLRATVDNYRSTVPLPEAQLAELAKDFVSREFDSHDLRCLGAGEEGVVLTDGSLVYKYFHYWKTREREQRIRFLKDLVGRLDGFNSLSPILDLRRNGDEVALVYPFRPGQSYAGGLLEDILTFLRECRDAGIVCRNVHPDNFIVTSEGLRFIDYGSDIRPFSEDEFTSMCRRAFLMYRFHFRNDLKELMRASLENFELPELTGFDHFLRALDPRSKEEILDEPLRHLVISERPASVLDYGCGKGKLAEALIGSVPDVVGYDPDPKAIATCLQYKSGARYLDREGIEGLKGTGRKFDAIICSLVLCTLGDDEFIDSLRELRALVAESGVVFVAVCNPFHTFVEQTELQRRHLPAESSYDGTFAFNKEIASTGSERTDVHRPLKTYTKAFTEARLAIDEVIETDGSDVKNLRPSSDFLVFKLRPLPMSQPKVSLLIKTCSMEWRIVERLIQHQVEQLEGPIKFFEKVVIVDSRLDGFTRQYDAANPSAHRMAMESLLKDGVIDRVIYAPEDGETINSAYAKWFGSSSSESHASNGQQLFATLHGFEVCRGDYVMQIDGDLLIGRRGRSHNYISEMIDVLESDQKALFVPISISKSEPTPYTSEGPDGDWRVEVRCSLFRKDRLESILPIQNGSDENRLEPWHRAFDRFIGSSIYRCYRGGDPRTFFIHVPNERKCNTDELFDIIDRVEKGFVPECQLDAVDLKGQWVHWAGQKRAEPFIFVICGRNVDSSRLLRCLDSLFSQTEQSWGAIITDDSSDNGMGEYLEILTQSHRDRITLIRNHSRRGLLQNTWRAVTQYCADPDSVIITLDADDALIGPHVLERIREGYESGADVTVGSMLRTDKEASYPPVFSDPRRNRGGNVWQHLRTFKKYLFDYIREDDLKLEGQWIELANDWAFMLPIVEMAQHPAHIPDKLYLYEPSDQKMATDVRGRERVISQIVSRPRYGIQGRLSSDAP